MTHFLRWINKLFKKELDYEHTVSHDELFDDVIFIRNNSEYWENGAEACFSFIVYRDTGEILDDSSQLCSQMEPPGTFKLLLGKKFKVIITASRALELHFKSHC